MRATLRSAGAGPDGGAFIGTDAQGADVLVHRLDGKALNDPSRQRRLDHRVSLHAQATRERQPLLLALRRATLTERPALLVVEHPRRSALDLPAWRDVDAARAGLRALHDGARALALLHAGGLAHGQLVSLGRAALRLRADGSAAIAALGLRTGLTGDVRHRGFLSGDVDGASDDHSIAIDGYAFGGICLLVALGDAATVAVPPLPTDGRLRALIAGVVELASQLRHDEPAWRLPLSEAAQHLQVLLTQLDRAAVASAEPIADAQTDPPPVPMEAPMAPGTEHGGEAEPAAPTQLGRFRIEALLGVGAMGRVYRGVDLDSGEPVAVKLLARDGPVTNRAMHRFKKEARLLAEIQSPGVARFLADGVQGTTLYLVTEFVDGEPLGQRLRARGPLPEREAVDVAVEVLRALADVHDHGIVHRDLKPDNMMLLSPPGAAPRVKLIDFGIARHLDEQGSLAMTRQGAVMGTPLYMAPEQVRGGALDQRADLYAIGSILFELLAGRAPFAGLGAAAVLACQLEQQPALVSAVAVGTSDEVTRVVARALQKNPEARYPDARAMLAELLPLSSDGRRQPPTTTPPATTQRWTSSWALRSSPEALWPYVSDTERVNQAIGLVSVEGGYVPDAGGVLLQGRSTQLGVALSWNEHPYEWVQGRRLSVHREYSAGPLVSLRSVVELHPGEGGRGTLLMHTLEAEPRGLVGRALASVEIGMRARRALDRVYTRIDALLSGLAPAGDGDAFAKTPPLSASQEAHLIAIEHALVKDGIAAPVVERLGRWLRAAPAQELARIRPLALATQLALPADAVVDACLRAAHRGALVLAWDLLCPLCRVPADLATTLKALQEHGRCEACNLAFNLDLSTSVELVFRTHPALREVDAGTYCLSSPAHTHHVFAQVRVPAGAVIPLELALPAGRYRLTARRAPWSHEFSVRDDAAPTSWRASLRAGPPRGTGHLLPSGGQRFVLDNDTDREQLVRVERTTPRDDALFASSALARPLFRRLFPGEVLAPGTLVRAGDVTVLLADLRTAATTPLPARHAALRALDDAVTQAGGAVVRLHGSAGVLATFATPHDAVLAARALPAAVAASGVQDGGGERAPAGVVAGDVAVAVNRGEAGAVTLGNHLDYFGGAIDDVAALARRARRGELVLSDGVRADADAAGVDFDVIVEVDPTLHEADDAAARALTGADDGDLVVPVHRASLRPRPGDA